MEEGAGATDLAWEGREGRNEIARVLLPYIIQLIVLVLCPI